MVPTPLTSCKAIHRPSTTKAGMATICRPSSTFTPRLREHEDIGAEHPGDRARGADIGHARFGSDGILRERRRDAGQQVEDQKFEVAEAVFDIVAEDPQKQHIAEQVQPAAMHEHRGEYGHQIGAWVVRKSGGNEGPIGDELVSAAKFSQEDQHVEADKRERDDRGGTPL